MEKRLTKSVENKKLCGVCGGFAEYLDVDATILRILFVFATLFCGGGLLVYLIAALLMPSGK